LLAHSNAFTSPSNLWSTRVSIDLLDWVWWLWCDRIWEIAKLRNTRSKSADRFYLTTTGSFHSCWMYYQMEANLISSISSITCFLI
jgi:hypothetical protein